MTDDKDMPEVIYGTVEPEDVKIVDKGTKKQKKAKMVNVKFDIKSYEEIKEFFKYCYHHFPALSSVTCVYMCKETGYKIEVEAFEEYAETIKTFWNERKNK